MNPADDTPQELDPQRRRPTRWPAFYTLSALIAWTVAAQTTDTGITDAKATDPPATEKSEKAEQAEDTGRPEDTSRPEDTDSAEDVEALALDLTPKKKPRFANWLDEVRPLITTVERELFKTLAKDYQREAFIHQFWKVRDPYPRTVRNELKERWPERVAQA